MGHFVRTLLVGAIIGILGPSASAQSRTEILIASKAAYGVQLLVPLDFQCGRSVEVYGLAPSEEIVEGIAKNMWLLLNPPPYDFPYTVGESWTNCVQWERMTIRMFVAPEKSRAIVVQRVRTGHAAANLSAQVEGDWEHRVQMKSSDFRATSPALRDFLKAFWQAARTSVDPVTMEQAGLGKLSYDERSLVYWQVGSLLTKSEALRVVDRMPLVGPAGQALAAPKGDATPTVADKAAGSKSVTSLPPELDGVPPQHRDAASAAFHGKAFNFTGESLLFMGGVASRLLHDCGLPGEIGERLRLALFVKAAQDRATLGSDYSNPNLGDSVRGTLAGTAVFAAGSQFAKALACTAPAASQLASGLARAVKANETAPDGGRPIFVTTCAPHFSELRCECVAKLGRAVIPNIYQMPYNREIIVRIIQGSPLVALQMATMCQISNY